MKRHPFVRTFQLACSVAMLLVGLRGPPPAEARAPEAMEFGLTVLGERERADGSWEGFDLLSERSSKVDRVQLTIRPARDARILVDALGPDGEQRLFPAFSASPLLEGSTAWALPAPSAFYEVSGQVRLRITLLPPEGAPAPSEALSSERRQQVVYPLTDGLPFTVTERHYSAADAAVLEIPVNGR